MLLEHDDAIRVLEEHAIALEHMTVPNRNTITPFTAQRNVREAAQLRATIEFLKKQKDPK